LAVAGYCCCETLFPKPSKLFTLNSHGINVDKNTAYPKAIDELKAKKELSSDVELRQNKYLNNRIEQNHRFING